MKKNIEEMSKAEKIELIEALADGNVTVINGEVYDTSIAPILFEREGKLYLEAECENQAPENIRELGFQAIMVLPFSDRQLNQKKYEHETQI